MDGVVILPGTGRLLVWGRAGVLGTAALATGAVSHVAGGGRLPGSLALLALLAVSVLAAARFLLTRASAGRLVLLVLAGQTLVHAALSALAGHHGQHPAGVGVTPPAAGPTNLYDHYATTVPTAPPRALSTSPEVVGEQSRVADGWVAHQVDHFVQQGPAMVLAHLVGAVVLGLFLAVGEQSLWRLIALGVSRRLVCLAADRIVRQTVGVAPGLGIRTVPAPDRLAALADSQVLGHDVDRRRGPPFLLAA